MSTQCGCEHNISNVIPNSPSSFSSYLRFKFVAGTERVLFNELVGSCKLKKTLKIKNIHWVFQVCHKGKRFGIMADSNKCYLLHNSAVQVVRAK